METAALSFERGWVLQFLWLLPLVVALFWWSDRKRKSAIGRIVAPKLRALLAGSTSPLRRWFRSFCVLAALALLIGALAGPRLGYDTLEVPHRGRDVIVAVDVSRSMLATDVMPTRLDRAKLFTEDLVGELGSDRIGLVAFAGSAFLQAPLTLDHGAVLSAVDELDTTLIPKGGTDLAAAIATADEAFGKAEGFSRAVVIVSDGEELSADGVAAAKNAATQGVRIFAVGVGSTEGSEIPDGSGEFIRDPDTRKVVNSKLDESRMKEIAEATGGFYTRLDDNAANLVATEGIGKMAEADITANSSRRPIERYQWPLGAAIALLMLQALIGERRRRRAVNTAVLAVFFFWPAGAWASPAGIEAYTEGNFEKAREAFEKRLGMEPESSALQLNAGTAAYRLKDYAKASQYFSRAALSDDAAVRSAAEYNFANTLFRQGEGQQDKEKKITDWKEAIAKYDAALKTRPGYTEAQENKARVEQLLKELEKEQKQEQQQQQKQDNKQQKKDEQQDQKDQQKKDQQQNQQQQQQQGGGQQDQKKEEQKDQNQSGSGNGSDQQKQDQQKQDEQKQNQQQGKDQQKQDQKEGEQKEQQSGGQGQNKDEKKQDQKDQQGQGEKKDQQQQGGQQDQKKEEEKQNQGQDEQKKDDGSGGEKPEDKKEEGEKGEQQKQPSQPGEGRPQSGQQNDERGPVPQQPQEKKEGELRGAGQTQPDKSQGEKEQAAVAGEKEEDGKMSEAQARGLLRALQSEEGKVDLLERQIFQDVSRDW